MGTAKTTAGLTLAAGFTALGLMLAGFLPLAAAVSLEWIATGFYALGTILAGLGAWFRQNSDDTAERVMWAVVAFMVLGLVGLAFVMGLQAIQGWIAGVAIAVAVGIGAWLILDKGG